VQTGRSDSAGAVAHQPLPRVVLRRPVPSILEDRVHSLRRACGACRYGALRTDG